MIKIVLYTYLITLLNLLILAVQYSLSNIVIIFILIIADLAIMLRHLIKCRVHIFSIRLFCFILFQAANTFLFYKFDVCNIIFGVINLDYGAPNAGAGFSMLVLFPTYVVSIAASILVSTIIHIFKINRKKDLIPQNQ